MMVGCKRVLASLVAVYERFQNDRIPEVAASATFFILLAIFPAFTSIVTIYGMVADRSSIANILAILSRFLPRGANVILNDELHRLIAQDTPKLGITFLISTAIATWSASGGLKALMYGLNVAYGAQETRGFIRRSLLAFATTAGAIFLSVLAITISTVLPVLVGALPFHSILRNLLPPLVWPLAFASSLIVLAALYHYGPNHRDPWRWLTWGSALSSILWLVGTLLFKWYVRSYGNFDRVYGSLGAVVGFLVWIWLTLVIILFGAELNSYLGKNAEHRR